MQHDMRDDEIEAAIGKVGGLGVLLTEVDRHAERLGARMRIAQHRRTDIDAMNASLRKRACPNHGAVADGAADIEDTFRFTRGMLLANVGEQRIAHQIVLGSERATHV